MKFPNPFEMPKEYQAAFERVVDAAYKNHAAAREELTEKQMIEALSQALACVDFQLLVRPDRAQAVTYMPFRREEELRAKIEELEGRLDMAGEMIMGEDN